MHQLRKEGKFESDEAEAAREAVDGIWDTLSPVEKKRLRGLSLDLKYLLKKDAKEPSEENIEKRKEIVSLMNEGKIDEALELLRAFQEEFYPHNVSSLRGQLWSEFRVPEVSLTF